MAGDSSISDVWISAFMEGYFRRGVRGCAISFPREQLEWGGWGGGNSSQTWEPNGPNWSRQLMNKYGLLHTHTHILSLCVCVYLLKGINVHKCKQRPLKGNGQWRRGPVNRHPHCSKSARFRMLLYCCYLMATPTHPFPATLPPTKPLSLPPPPLLFFLFTLTPPPPPHPPSQH